MNKFNRALVEIMSEIPKNLYDVLETRRVSAQAEDERLRELILLNICSVIAKEEINRILEEAKKEF